MSTILKICIELLLLNQKSDWLKTCLVIRWAVHGHLGPLVRILSRIVLYLHFKWASAWQNQQNGMCASEDSDQPGHPPSLICVFAVRSVCSWGPKLYSCGQQRLWSDWVFAGRTCHFVGFVMRWLKLFTWRLCREEELNNENQKHRLWVFVRTASVYKLKHQGNATITKHSLPAASKEGEMRNKYSRTLMGRTSLGP